MKSKILSLSISKPEALQWNNKTISSSMNKRSVDQLIVHEDRIEGDIFAETSIHGTADSILYIVSKTMGDQFFQKIGLGEYQKGAIGENILVDEFDESQVNVGDIFQIGEVQVQATFPRRPCSKVNFRFQNPEAMKAMLDLQRSGVYFRVLKPGVIRKTDEVVLAKKTDAPFSIRELYILFTKQRPATQDDYDRLSKNSGLPAKQLKKLSEMLALTQG